MVGTSGGHRNTRGTWRGVGMTLRGHKGDAECGGTLRVSPGFPWLHPGEIWDCPSCPHLGLLRLVPRNWTGGGGVLLNSGAGIGGIPPVPSLSPGRFPVPTRVLGGIHGLGGYSPTFPVDPLWAVPVPRSQLLELGSNS